MFPVRPFRKPPPISGDEGAKLNLERALRLGDELGGHIVTGHVDAVVEVIGVSPEGNSTRLGLARAARHCGR